MKKKKIRNQLIRAIAKTENNIYRIICVNEETQAIWIAEEFVNLESAKNKIDIYTQDNVKLFIQNKNSNRIVYTR